MSETLFFPPEDDQKESSLRALPKSAIWSRLVSPRLSLKCKRLEAPPPGLLMLHHAPLPHFLNEIESFLGLLLLFDSIQQPSSGAKNGLRSLPLVLEQAKSSSFQKRSRKKTRWRKVPSCGKPSFRRQK